MAPPERSFPYMFWARDEAPSGAHVLSQSGMPVPERLGAGPGLDTLLPPSGPLADLEGRLAARLGVAPERVLMTLGTSGAMHLLAWHFFPGARVVTETPSYEPFRALPGLVGAAETRVVPRAPRDGWRLDPQRLAAELAGARPGHLFLATPHNPTGVRSSPAEVEQQASLAAQHGGVLISNEVYMEFAAPKERFHAACLAPNGVSIGSLTKAYGLGPLRLGWIVLGEALGAERGALRDLAFLSYVDPPTPSLALGLALWDRLEELRHPFVELRQGSGARLAAWLSRCELVEGELGPCGLHAFPRIVGVQDTWSLHRFLAREFGVVVVPGEFFGRPGHVRLGFGLPPDPLTLALERLEAGIRSFLASPTREEPPFPGSLLE